MICPHCKSENIVNLFDGGYFQAYVCQDCVKAFDDKPDLVNHPPHYTFGKFEVLDVIEDWGLNYCLGNAVKYIARAGRKNPDKKVEDLRKAVFYLEREIKQEAQK
jgi:hypothetical protein